MILKQLPNHLHYIKTKSNKLHLKGKLNHKIKTRKLREGNEDN